jgi:AraC-like DNA-binding protein
VSGTLERIQRAIDFVEAHLSEDLPLTAVAERGGCSPWHTYAVLTHRGHISRLPDTVKHVWGRWLPASEYRHVTAPDFELYDPERWDPATGEGDVDLYVPIAGE